MGLEERFVPVVEPGEGRKEGDGGRRQVHDEVGDGLGDGEDLGGGDGSGGRGVAGSFGGDGDGVGFARRELEEVVCCGLDELVAVLAEGPDKVPNLWFC